MHTLTSQELHSLLEKNPETLTLIDVRNTGEFAEIRMTWVVVNIPLPLLPLKMNEIDTSKQVVFICRSGGRSWQACQFVEQSGITAYNLVWGMIDWEARYPTQVKH